METHVPPCVSLLALPFSLLLMSLCMLLRSAQREMAALQLLLTLALTNVR